MKYFWVISCSMFVPMYDIAGRSAKSNTDTTILLCHPGEQYINNLYITETDLLSLADSPFTPSNS